MKKDAELHAEEDKKKRELIETRNIADQLIYGAEKALKDADGIPEGEKRVPEDIRRTVEDKITALKAVKDGEDVIAIKNASDALSQEMQKIGEALMKASASAEGSGETKQENPASDKSSAGDNNPSDSPEGNVRDAETKE